MSGGNYNISVTQILESEKKRKLMGLLTLNSSICGKFRIKSLQQAHDEHETDNITDKEEDFEDAVTEADHVSIANNMMALVYIAGYVANSISCRMKCDQCKKVVIKDLEVEAGHFEIEKYLKILNRAGLKWPTDFRLEIITGMYKLFQCLI